MASSDSNGCTGCLGAIAALFLLASLFYAVFGIHASNSKGLGPFEVFSLELGLATTSGLLAPINSKIRNKDEYGNSGYESDLDRYGDVYEYGLDNHPIALILGDVFGSFFSIVSFVAFFIARNHPEEGMGFKIMFFTELAEEALYYINIKLMTGRFDIGLIDIVVTFVIALIVGAIGESARKKNN